MTVPVIRLKGEEADEAAKISERLKSIWKAMEDAEKEKRIAGTALSLCLNEIAFGDGFHDASTSELRPLKSLDIPSKYEVSLSDDENSIVVVSKFDPHDVDVIRLNRDEYADVQELLAEARAHKARRNDLRDEKKRTEGKLDQLLYEIALRENEEYRIAYEDYNRAIEEEVESNKAIVAAGGIGEGLFEIDPPATKLVLSNDGRSIVLLKK